MQQERRHESQTGGDTDDVGMDEGYCNRKIEEKRTMNANGT